LSALEPPVLAQQTQKAATVSPLLLVRFLPLVVAVVLSVLLLVVTVVRVVREVEPEGLLRQLGVLGRQGKATMVALRLGLTRVGVSRVQVVAARGRLGATVEKRLAGLGVPDLTQPISVCL
jgi:hypothetical protein